MPAHHAGIEPRRIEGAFVIGAPAGSRNRRPAAHRPGGRRTDGQCVAVPMQRAHRRQDRPAHAAKAVDKKLRRGFQNEMIGLEPGDEIIRRSAYRFGGSAQRHASCAGRGARDFSIRCRRWINGSLAISSKRGFAMPQAPDQLIKQRITLGIAVADQKRDQFRHRPRQRRPAARRLHRLVREQCRRAIPAHRLRRHILARSAGAARRESRPGRRPAQQRHATSCEQAHLLRRASRARRSARSVSRAGV